MEIDAKRNKIDAIYELRDAVEAKTHAEQDLATTGSETARDALLEAQLDVEAKTQDVIEVCGECGSAHGAAGEHFDHGRSERVSGRHDNVITVDFRPDARPA